MIICFRFIEFIIISYIHPLFFHNKKRIFIKDLKTITLQYCVQNYISSKRGRAYVILLDNVSMEIYIWSVLQYNFLCQDNDIWVIILNLLTCFFVSFHRHKLFIMILNNFSCCIYFYKDCVSFQNVSLFAVVEHCNLLPISSPSWAVLYLLHAVSLSLPSIIFASQASIFFTQNLPKRVSLE